VLGTGGAGRALAFGAAERGASVVVAGRNTCKAADLAAQVGAACSSTVSACAIQDVQEGKLGVVDVLLNTTPLGMAGALVDQTPVPKAVLEQVCDLLEAEIVCMVAQVSVVCPGLCVALLH
jgi:shikimate 5-dehydrogenase